MVLLLLFSRLLCLSPLVIIAHAFIDCPMPECDFCVPAAVRDAPGIGFELTTSYGTSSVKLHNGSIIDVARVAASPTYIHLLRRLSLSSETTRPSTLQRYFRFINKSLGRPTTKDVGTLSELIRSLRAATEDKLNQTLDRIVVATPQFPGLTRYDLEDAIEYAGLKSWLEYALPYATMLHAPNAAFAADGRGLCKEWRNLYACLDEATEGEIPFEQVYTVSRDDYAHISVPELGLAALHSYPSPSAYWAEIRNHLQILPRAAAERGRPTTAVLLIGESIENGEFTDVLNDALSSAGINLEEASRSPVWDVARGAALYARIRQEVPWDCREPEDCWAPIAMAREMQHLLRKERLEL